MGHFNWHLVALLLRGLGHSLSLAACFPIPYQDRVAALGGLLLTAARWLDGV